MVYPYIPCLQVRAEVKASGLLDTADNCWDFFTKRVGLC